MAITSTGFTGLGLLVMMVFFLKVSAKKITFLEREIGKVAVLEDRINSTISVNKWIQNEVINLQLENSHRKREILAWHKRLDKEKENGSDS